VDVELEALQTFAALVQDLVLGGVDGPSVLAAPQSMVAVLFKSQVNTAAANGVRWGPVTFSGAEVRAGAAWVWAKCRPDQRSGGCPLAHGEHGLGLAGVACSFLVCPRLPR
jgi:hypothetical protein